MSMFGKRFLGSACAGRLAALAAGTLLGFLPWAACQAQPPRDADTGTVRGKVEQFTTAPGGETDGAVLDDGTWLHWPPHMQDRFADALRKGDRVRATGRTEAGPAGDTHFEVRSVTNLRTDDTAENPDFANGPPPPPPGPRGRVAPGRPADREQRLRGLEDQVDQIRREIERLKRDR
jgi:hypothetical protein